MPTASDRQKPWPRYAAQARQRVEQTANDYAELLQQAMQMLERIQDVAYDNPALVVQLAIQTQRDIALTIAAFASIKMWMVEAKRGRLSEEERGPGSTCSTPLLAIQAPEAGAFQVGENDLARIEAIS